MLVAQGKSNKEIAHELVIAVRTVSGHLNLIYLKLGVHNRVQTAILNYQFKREEGGKVYDN